MHAVQLCDGVSSISTRCVGCQTSLHTLSRLQECQRFNHITQYVHCRASNAQLQRDSGAIREVPRLLPRSPQGSPRSPLRSPPRSPLRSPPRSSPRLPQRLSQRALLRTALILVAQLWSCNSHPSELCTGLLMKRWQARASRSPRLPPRLSPPRSPASCAGPSARPGTPPRAWDASGPLSRGPEQQPAEWKRGERGAPAGPSSNLRNEREGREVRETEEKIIWRHVAKPVFHNLRESSSLHGSGRGGEVLPLERLALAAVGARALERCARPAVGAGERGAAPLGARSVPRGGAAGPRGDGCARALPRHAPRRGPPPRGVAVREGGGSSPHRRINFRILGCFSVTDIRTNRHKYTYCATHNFYQCWLHLGQRVDGAL